MTKQIKYLDYEGLKALYGVVDGKVAKAIADEVAARNTAITTAIEGLDVTDDAVDGQFVTAVSETDGKVNITRSTVAAKNVTAEAVTAADAVTVEGGTVASQIVSLAKSLKTVEGNAAKYKVVKLSDTEVEGLSDGANVREAYKVVSYVGDDIAHAKPVGEVIKIYKDANLEKAELGTGEDAQNLILTYILADGSTSVVKIDFAAIAFNTEFKNGLQVAKNGEISVKIDTASEGFLTVGEGGVKLAGVREAINTAKAAATTKVKKDTAAAHITVTAGAPAEDGSVTYTIGETNIASDDALTAEVSRAKAAEDKIEASVGLATDGSFTAPAGNYINGATTVMGAVETLDVQAKANADKIAGMSVDEVNQTVTIDSKGLQFVAFTKEEIKKAATEAAGN